MIAVREAAGQDVLAIRDLILATYGTDYSPKYYDESQLTRLVYSDDNLLLVAEDTETRRVVGTASVDLEVGAHSDLVAEFGRLIVHPAFRRRGVGKLLMTERLRRVEDRVQVGLVEARIAQPYSVRIAEANRFAPVGFLPHAWRLRERESLMLLVRYFGNALQLRKNHPRIVPEIYPLGHQALGNCGITPDLVVDEEATAYPSGKSFDLQELTTDGYSALLRIERGRVRHREIFGPLRLHYGIFKLVAKRSTYLIAREEGRIMGAVGFTVDSLDKTVRIIELIALDDGVIRVLLNELERAWTQKLGGPAEVIVVEVSAHAPRMQRTLIELGFLPVAYVPALVFDQVERLDSVRMLQLPSPPKASPEGLSPSCKRVADLILRRFESRNLLPRVTEVVHRLPLFAGLDSEQVTRLAGVCGVATFAPGRIIFREGQEDRRMHVVLSGEVAITVSESATVVGTLRSGECLGEMSLLTSTPHSVTATARTGVETAVLEHRDLIELIRLRPDIGLCIYRNLAVGTGEKLKRLNASLGSR